MSTDTFPQEWAYYQGNILSQQWIEYNANKDKGLQLVVRLNGKLSDGNNPKSAVTPLSAPQDITSILKFPPDQQTLQKTLRKLRLLGYTESNLDKLTLSGKKGHTFVGVTSLFQASPADEKGRTYFNVAAPKAREAISPEDTKEYLGNLSELWTSAVSEEDQVHQEVAF